MKHTQQQIEKVFAYLEKLGHGPYSMHPFGVLWESFTTLKEAIDD